MAEIGCAGILVADTFCGPMPRLPSEGELLVVDRMSSSAGGCAANVAIDLVKQGFTVDVAGCVGTDLSAESLLQGLREHQIDGRHVARTADYVTSRTIILVVEGQDRRYLHDFGANSAFSVAHIDRQWAASLKLFYLGGLFAMPAIDIEELAELLAFLRTSGVTTVVDVVVPQTFDHFAEASCLLPHIDYFLPSTDEAQRLTGATDPPLQLEALLERGARTVIITLGDQGCLVGDGAHLWQSSAYSMRSIDPSGAGDAFACGVITGIRRGWQLDETLKYAAALGGSATLELGTTGSVFDAKQAQAYVAAHPLAVERKEVLRRAQARTM